MVSARVLRMTGLAAALALACAGAASADYETHPELRPELRCATIPPGASVHCQPLFWDLKPATRLGFRAAAAPIESGRPPWYPNGLTDRPPPLFILDANRDGKSDDGGGYERPGKDRVPLCRDPDEVPWWKPAVDAGGKPVVGRDPTFGQTGPLFEVACRRGTRAYFGPWQIGRRPETRDDVAEGVLRFENSARLDRDVAKRGLDPKRHGRVEWHTGTEFYQHFATHHSVCWNPENSTCNNPRDPWSASDPAKCHAGYQEVADGPQAPGGKGGCYAGDQDVTCRKPDETDETVREFSMYPDRVVFVYGAGEAELALEDQLADCYLHLVPELPPRIMYHVRISNFGLDGRADYRLQAGGLPNLGAERRHGVEPGQVIGGAVGELVVQYFTEPFTAPGLKQHVPAASVRQGGLEDFIERSKKGSKPESSAAPTTPEATP